ncbi:Predicted nuclease of the RNAse H fold, HicB family [Microbispora rosea]|uniref:Predicted nuclease of the RNAse H fold, HicB family n=4 Tax=Streptosporangiaceae TaxID=2004 RepID=A0A1N6UWA0_9ACTN|nr:hypothetical protein Mro03_18650 [Microbispora rosea subsp. rosea]SIQ69857.1 Predicted nuclease of the RNAse H fold, HicB family [Microbispora rosea]
MACFYRRVRRSALAYASGMSQTVSLTATVTPDEEGWYVARCVQVEVASQGRTVDEALASLRDALELYFEDEPLPQTPQQPIVAPIEIRRSA